MLLFVPTIPFINFLIASHLNAPRFENYLRDNFGKISISPLIPLFEELEHLKYYVDIEQIRFPNLKVEYDTDIDYFMVPSLSIQPMVENAIRHGIQKKQFGEGTIKIKSFEDEKGFYITIEDDGVGIISLRYALSGFYSQIRIFDGFEPQNY